MTKATKSPPTTAERLRRHLDQAHVSIRGLAAEAEVDPKTIQRILDADDVRDIPLVTAVLIWRALVRRYERLGSSFTPDILDVFSLTELERLNARRKRRPRT